MFNVDTMTLFFIRTNFIKTTSLKLVKKTQTNSEHFEAGKFKII